MCNGNLQKLEEAGIAYFILVEDGDGHTYAVNKPDVERVNAIFEKDWDDWTEEENDFIEYLPRVDPDDCVAVFING